MNDNHFRIFFVIPPEVQLLDITGAAHVFYEASEYGASITAFYIGMEPAQEVKSSAGLVISQIEYFEQFTLKREDIIFIPGMESSLFRNESFQQNSTAFYEWLKDQWLNGARVCSVCTGAYLLGQSGILDGKSCTTHWKYIQDFKKRFPASSVLNDRLFVKDGNIYSSAGVASGIDLSLYLLEELYGSAFASDIAKEIVVYLRRTEADPQLSVFLQYRNHIENRIHVAQDFISKHFSQQIGIEKIAEEVNMSPRNLTRLFKKTTGITIGQYVDKLRVERAVQLLSEGNKVESVSKMCGLSSPNQLRSILKKYTGILPSNMS